MSILFSEVTVGPHTYKNRVWVPPMCQYSAIDGLLQDWHAVHYGAFITGGAGLVMVEATAVAPEGRISAGDLGIWTDQHAQVLAEIPRFAKRHNTKVGIQIAHAGRKGSCHAPWKGGAPLTEAEGGWETIAPSSVAFEGYPTPREMTIEDINKVRYQFAAGVERAVMAEFDVIEIHSAHGYLLHEFLSPLSNQRTDEYGGSFENRIRLLLEIVSEARLTIPQHRSLFVRISATDWIEGGWDVAQSVALTRELHARGVDLVDVSSGGLSMRQDIPLGPGYQVPAARTIAQETGTPVSAVGIITTGAQAEEILSDGDITAVMIGRASLGNPRWAYQAAQDLGEPIPWADQYARGFLARS